MKTVVPLREWLALHRDRVEKVDRGVLVGARPPYASVRLEPAPNLASINPWPTVIDRGFRESDPLPHPGLLARSGEIQIALGPRNAGNGKQSSREQQRVLHSCGHFPSLPTR